VAHPEANLISAILRTGDLSKATDEGISPDTFHVCRAEAKFIFSHFERKGHVPSKAAFRTRFADFRMKAVDDVDFFAGEVRENHVRQTATNSLNAMIEDLSVGDVESVMRRMHSTAMDMETTLNGGGENFDVIQAFKDIADEAERRHRAVEENGHAGISTGFPTLDEITGGIQPGWVFVVAARLGSGKTGTMIKMASRNLFDGHSVQFNALEMTRAEVAMRFHAYASSQYAKGEFRATDLARGLDFSPKAYREFLHKLATQISGQFHVIDVRQGGLTPLSLAAQLDKNKPDIAYVDYLTLMETGANGGGRNRAASDDDWRTIAALSKRLKMVAGQTGIPLVLAAQLSRKASNTGDAPDPSDIAESDAIGRDADGIVMVQKRSNRVLSMKLAKFRHGPDGQRWWCAYEPNVGRFEEIDGDEAGRMIREDENQSDTVRRSHNTAGRKKLKDEVAERRRIKRAI
jgi:replicative DNA helicase